jgi:hypothetical protein
LAGGVVLDAGVLVAAERNEKRFWAVWDEIIDLPKLVPTPVLAQVWRGQPSAALERVLKACRIQILDVWAAKRVGELCARTRTSDIADATVMFLASLRGDDVLTTDLRDMRRLTAGLVFRGRIMDFDAFRP